METTLLSLASLELDKLEAVVELMMLAAYSDGFVHDAERAAFRSHLLAQTHRDVRPEVLERLLVIIESGLAQAAPEVRLASIRARLSDTRLRRQALELAARVVLADGQLAVDEKAFIARAASALEIEPDEASALVLGLTETVCDHK